MKRSVSSDTAGSHREKTSPDAPAPVQCELNLLDPQSISDDIADGYEALRAAVTAHGGQKKLALEMGESLDYNSKVNEGLNRKGDRHAFFDWIVPVLRDPNSEPVLMAFFCPHRSAPTRQASRRRERE